MTRRLLLAIALTAVGVLSLWLAVGEAGVAGQGTNTNQPLVGGDQRSTPGVFVEFDDHNDGGKTAASISIEGGGRLPRMREVLLPNGDRRLLEVYELEFGDCRPIENLPGSEFRAELRDVTITFFDEVSGAPEPAVEAVARLAASRAFVQLGVNDAGLSSIDESRDMDLYDVVLTSTPTARVRDLRLEVARLLVRNDDGGLSLRTPDDRMPFRLNLGGDDPLSVDGNGLVATLPTTDAALLRGATGDTEGGGVIELIVHSHPILVRGENRVEATGSLHYHEALATGFGRLEVRDDVRLLRDAASGRGYRVAAERLIGHLVRRRTPGERSNDAAARWLTLLLRGEGERVRVETRDYTVACDDLTITPGSGEEPGVLTASGTPELERRDGATSRFRAEREIHVVRLHELAGPAQRAFGASLPHLAHELIVFVGRSRLSGDDGLELTADGGLHLIRDEADTLLACVGRGAVSVTRGDLRIESGDGFLLTQRGARQVLRLGPEQPDAAHAFALRWTDRRGAAPRELAVDGHGLCEVAQGADGTTALTLRSPVEDIVLVAADGELRAVRELDARLAGQELRSFVASGARAEITRTLSGRTVRGHAGRIEARDRSTLWLTAGPGEPAELDSEEHRVRVTGAVIEVRAVGDDVAVVVSSDSPDRRATLRRLRAPASATTVDAAAAGGRSPFGGPGDDLELVGDTLRLLPLEEHAWPVPWPSWPLPRPAAAAGRHLLATGDVRVRSESARGTLDARGDSLWMHLDDVAGLLSGHRWPASVTFVDAERRSTVARARQVRFATADGGGEELELWPTDDLDPTLDLFGSEDEHYRLVCGGPIRAIGTLVELDGPVHVRTIGATGAIDLDGLDLTAGSMHLVRDPRTGDVVELHSHSETTVTWAGTRAWGDRAELDLRAGTCVVDGGRIPARVELPDGLVLESPVVWANPRDRTFRAWHLRLNAER